jgi:flagellar basal-body rod protein FlgC
MSAINGTNAALSALDAFFRRVSATSHNLANLETDGFKKVRVDLVEGPAGGVEARPREIDTPGDVVAKEGEEGVEYTESSNVNLAEEMVCLLTALRSYQANLKSLEVQTEMEDALLDIVG